MVIKTAQASVHVSDFRNAETQLLGLSFRKAFASVDESKFGRAVGLGVEVFEQPTAGDSVQVWSFVSDDQATVLRHGVIISS
jgi:hypothetical protein